MSIGNGPSCFGFTWYNVRGAAATLPTTNHNIIGSPRRPPATAPRRLLREAKLKTEIHSEDFYNSRFLKKKPIHTSAAGCAEYWGVQASPPSSKRVGRLSTLHIVHPINQAARAFPSSQITHPTSEPREDHTIYTGRTHSRCPRRLHSPHTPPIAYTFICMCALAPIARSALLRCMPCPAPRPASSFGSLSPCSACRQRCPAQ